MESNKMITEEQLTSMFQHCADVTMKRFQLGTPNSQSIILISCSGMTDIQQINQFILPRLEQIIQEITAGRTAASTLEWTRVDQASEVEKHVFTGRLLIFFSQQNAVFSLDIAKVPNRTTEESNTEISIKGPRDGFIESVETNAALIRKRLPIAQLRYEQITIGKKSNTVVALLFMHGVCKDDVVNELRARLNSIEVDTLLGTTQLEEMLSDTSFSLFPFLDYSGRPDFVVEGLSRGRAALLVDGSPMAVIAPANFTQLLKSPEDIYSPFYIVAFEMIIRFTGLIISMFLPGFWVALAAYNMEQLPFPLLATLVMARQGLPLPGPLESFLMLAMFELFRESGLRLPKAVGQTIAVVGGIVVGDAVIRAGLASTTMLIVSAVTAVATFTLVNQTLATSVTLIRFFVLLCASVLGMYGFVLAVIAVVLYLSALESFGMPYLAPISPLKPKQLISGLFKDPRNGNRSRKGKSP